MAINKERLQELINEGATIYDKDGYSIDLSKRDSFIENIFEFYYKIEDNRLLKMQKQPHIALNHWWIKDLYETKEQAEWSFKYHKTRIEELNLPYWTDIVEHKDDDIYKIASVRTKNGNTYNLLFKKGDLTLWNVRELMFIWIDLATKENYTKLCDLCVKLFEEEQK